MEDQRNIFNELTFGVKWAKNNDSTSVKRTKLPLRILPKESPTQKRRKLEADEIDGNFGAF
jgi:hypothetical protein